MGSTGGGAGLAAVRMFGPLGIGAGRDAIGPRDLGGIKPKQLLEILLLERGRIVTKDRLADEPGS